MRKNSVILLTCLVLAALVGCSKQERFTIEGNVSEAAGKMLYLDQMGVSKTVAIDSVRLKKDGHFRFKQARSQYPELYRLRLDKQILIVAIDSTEQLHVTAQADSLSFDAVVVGSDKTLQITELRKSLQEATTAEALTAHKQKASEVILRDPRSIVAYFALLQHKNGQFVFNLADKQDRVYFAAVATAWHAFMPDSEHAKKIYGIVDETIRNERKFEQAQAMQAFIEESDNAFLDITLPNENGKEQSLSTLRGKVLLVDFSMISMQQGKAYIFELRELYNKYHAQGFDIYQVSVDDDIRLWEESAVNLPWVTVHSDADSRQCLRTYNVQAIPTHFLINKKGEVIGRDIPFDQLPKRIEECLR